MHPASVFPPPVKRLLYHTWQEQRARQRSHKGKSIHFLQNIESGLPFHPQRDTQIHSYSFCCALSFYLFRPALFFRASLPHPIPPSLLLLSLPLWTAWPSSSHLRKIMHLGAFWKHLTPVKFKREICTISYACFSLFSRCLGGRGTGMGDARAAVDRVSHVWKSTLLTSLLLRY